VKDEDFSRALEDLSKTIRDTAQEYLRRVWMHDPSLTGRVTASLIGVVINELDRSEESLAYWPSRFASRLGAWKAETQGNAEPTLLYRSLEAPPAPPSWIGNLAVPIIFFLVLLEYLLPWVPFGVGILLMFVPYLRGLGWLAIGFGCWRFVARFFRSRELGKVRFYRSALSAISEEVRSGKYCGQELARKLRHVEERALREGVRVGMSSLVYPLCELHRLPPPSSE
jgi:hypothetical protein